MVNESAEKPVDLREIQLRGGATPFGSSDVAMDLPAGDRPLSKWTRRS
jgi:hypothetical protein